MFEVIADQNRPIARFSVQNGKPEIFSKIRESPQVLRDLAFSLTLIIYYHCFFVYPYQPNSFYKQSEHYPRPGQGGRPSKCEVRRPRAASTSSLVVPKIRYNHRPSFLFQNTIIPTQLTCLACFNAHMKYHTLNSCERFGRASLYKYWLLMREMVKTISPRCSGDRYYFPAGRRPKGK